jgi:DNA-binding MarR family transcriptional regulator
MGEILKKRLRQARFESPVHEALLNLMVAAAHLRDLHGQAYTAHDVTPAQYNVLRILKGAHPHGYPRCEISERMIERAPDLTRMIDRLEKRGLVERLRSEKDGRHSVTRVTRRGLELVEAMAPTVEAMHKQVAEHLTRKDAQELSRLCEKLYGER